MIRNRTFFHITTESRVYTGIDSQEHFARVRGNWQDTGRVIRAFIWVEGSGWVDHPEARNW